MTKVNPREASNVIKTVRNFLTARRLNQQLRHRMNQSTRDPEPPQLPEGPSHQLSKNYYFSRDARRAVEPPLELNSPASKKLPVPGVRYIP